jgi:hypothetical protein
VIHFGEHSPLLDSVYVKFGSFPSEFRPVAIFVIADKTISCRVLRCVYDLHVKFNVLTFSYSYVVVKPKAK